MESVMNFLAENYIWFFVAAGVLLFALIGFLVDSKNKSKKEFKGESIETSTPEVKTEELTETIDLNTQIKAESENPIIEETPIAVSNEEVVKTEENVNNEETIIFETPVFEEKPVNPELEENKETISFGTIPEITKEDVANASSDVDTETLNW